MHPTSRTEMPLFIIAMCSAILLSCSLDALLLLHGSPHVDVCWHSCCVSSGTIGHAARGVRMCDCHCCQKKCSNLDEKRTSLVACLKLKGVWCYPSCKDYTRIVDIWQQRRDQFRCMIQSNQCDPDNSCKNTDRNKTWRWWGGRKVRLRGDYAEQSIRD